MTRMLDRVMDTTTTTGTGTLTLSGTPVTGFQAFSAVGNANSCYFCTTDGTNWEVAKGVYTSSGTTLSRSTILASSNGGSAVNWGAGTKQVFVVAPAAFLKHPVDQTNNTSWDDTADTIQFYDNSQDDLRQITRDNFLLGGLYRLPTVRVVATTNGTLSSAFANGQVVDGYTLATNDLIALIGQSTASQNGLYKVAASGSPTRITALPTGASAAGLIFSTLGDGTTFPYTTWLCISTPGSDVVGTNSLTFRSIGQSALVSDTDGSTITFDLNLSKLRTVTLGGNRTLALSNVKVGDKFIIDLVQDGTGTRTVTWFTTIKWFGGSAPTLTTAINKTDSFGFICTSSGNYLGYVLGQNA